MQQTHYLRKSLRFAEGLVALSIAAIGMCAQNLPATQPTSLPVQASGPTSEAAAPANDTPLHAEVIYTNGQLQVRADNSSLNQILRSISHVTGLKITGGVQEQRVFGNYGPAPLSTILATLLDGIGANTLLLGGSPGTPPELILTSRAGGAEPPGPNSSAYAMYDDSIDHANRVPPQSPPASGIPTQTPPLPTTASPPQSKVVTPSSPPTSALPTAATSGKPLTPEMVQQELLQMQAQQDQKKRQLDQKIQQEQADQAKRLDAAKRQNQSNQPPASPNPPQ